jgi:hypothetical protein
MNAPAVRSVLILLSSQLPALGQQSWQQRSFTGPAARTYHALAFDSSRSKVVLFGGYTGSIWLQDTWEWNGIAWTQTLVPGPSARGLHAMAYDSQRGRIVLFGGTCCSGTQFQDTWEWSGTSWQQVATTGPSPRSDHGMAYDSLRGRVVLFGGHSQSAGTLGDTWEWDGTSWTPMVTASGPPARASHTLAFDSTSGRTVMFGGNSSSLGFLGDTWEWNGTQWTPTSSTGPVARGDHAMAYDTIRSKVVLFGGRQNGGNIYHDTWEWDGVTWLLAANTGPQARFETEMAFDASRGRLVLFGGNAVNGLLGDSWERGLFMPSGGAAFGTGCGTPPLALAAIPSAPPSIGATAQAAISNAPTPFAFVALGVSNTTFGPFTLPVSLASIGMPGCNLLQSANVIGESTSPTGAGTAVYSLAIPNNTALVGVHVYLQAWAVAPGVNPAQIVVSNGLDWTIGN